MDNVFIEYRDPLFSIISIFIIVFLISVISFISSLSRAKKNKKIFANTFAKIGINENTHKKKIANYQKLYKKRIISFDDIVCICDSLVANKQYNEAVSLYLMALKHTSKKKEQLELMSKIANLYYKNGFLQRSCDMFLEIISLKPNHITALKKVFIISIKLNNYSLSRDVLQSLKELKAATNEELILYKIKKLINSDKTLEKKTQKLINICTNNKNASRMVASFLLLNNPKAFWSNINIFDIHQCMDLLFLIQIENYKDYKKTINDNEFLKYIYYHKNKDFSTPPPTPNGDKRYFEIDILNCLKYSCEQTNNNPTKRADIVFSFFCNKCKKTHYNNDFICDYCDSVFKSSISMKLINKPNA